jgi:hypothetical protein
MRDKLNSIFWYVTPYYLVESEENTDKLLPDFTLLP